MHSVVMPAVLPTVLPVLLSAFAVTVLLSGCADDRDQPWVDARLYFGLSNEKGEISAADFTAFSDASITPLFPDGLTVFHADGQWQAPNNAVIKEKSAVVELIYHDTQDNRDHLFAIIDQYKRQFHQQAVLLVVTPPSVDFHRADTSAEPSRADRACRNGI